MQTLEHQDENLPLRLVVEDIKLADYNFCDKLMLQTIYVMEDEPFRFMWKQLNPTSNLQELLQPEDIQTAQEQAKPLLISRKYSSRQNSLNRRFPEKAGDGEMSKERKQKLKPLLPELTLNIVNIKNLRPEEDTTSSSQVTHKKDGNKIANQIILTPPKIKDSLVQILAIEDLIVEEPNIETRFAKVVRKFNQEQLRSTCQVMKGCRPHKAQQISKFVFEQIQQQMKTLQLQPKGKSITMPVSQFSKVLQMGFHQSEFTKPDIMKDFLVASMLMQSKINVIVLLAGTSGTGKSTLASLVGARFGIQTVLSTDSIRHVMRNFIQEKDNPILFCSTYEAGAMVKDEDKIELSESQVTIKGYKQQSKLVQSELSKVIERANSRNESIVVEGVHLDVKYLQKMMKRYPSCIPFVLYIKSKHKHGERFAVRAKHMTIDPRFNKYVSSLKQIRTIQDYLLKNSEEVLIPRIENHNVDRSVSLIQTTVMRCLHKIVQGEKLYDQIQKRATGIHDVEQTIHKNQLNSKQAQSFIKMKVNKEEILNQFFQNISGREGLDPEYQRRLQKYRPSASHEAKCKNIWKDKEEKTKEDKNIQEKTKAISKSKDRPHSIHNIFVKSELTKQEKKQIRKDLIGGKKHENPIDVLEENEVIPEQKKRESDEQREKEIEKLKEAKIRIEKQEEIEKHKELADGIRTAAHEEARKRNKSQDNAAQHEERETPTRVRENSLDAGQQEIKSDKQSKQSFKSDPMSAKDDLVDPEVDHAFMTKPSQIQFEEEKKVNQIFQKTQPQQVSTKKFGLKYQSASPFNFKNKVVERKKRNRNLSTSQNRLGKFMDASQETKLSHIASHQASHEASVHSGGHQSDQIQHQWDEDVNKVAEAEQQSHSDQSLSQIGSLVSYSINYLEQPQRKIQANDLGVLAEAEGSSDSDNSLQVEKESQDNQSSHEEDDESNEEEVDLSQSEASEHEGELVQNEKINNLSDQPNTIENQVVMQTQSSQS